jgi:hypothetical protein
MIRKIPLPRYRVDQTPRQTMVDVVWRDTSPDYKGSNKTIMYEGRLTKVSDLPDDELMEMYVLALRKKLERKATADNLDLYELNPDDPENSILFADSEALFRMNSRWEPTYIQPSYYDVDELLKALQYTQVLAAIMPEATSHELLAEIRDRSNYVDWSRLETEGAIVRDDQGNLSFFQLDEPNTVLIKYSNKTFRIRDVRDLTTEEALERSIPPEESYRFISGLPPGSQARHVYHRENIVNPKRLRARLPPKIH